MRVLWTRTVQAGTLLPGDYVRRGGARHSVMAARLVPDEVQPAVELVVRDRHGSDTRLLMDAYQPVALLGVAP